MSLREQNSYDVIGTVGSPVTLTAAYTGNRTADIMAKYLPNIHLDIQYTPKNGQTNRYAYILLEASNDDGVTYFPVGVKSTGSSEIDVFLLDTDGNAGEPWIIPGSKVSTGAVVYSVAAEGTIVAEKLRISVKENGSDNFGTLFCRISLTS